MPRTVDLQLLAVGLGAGVLAALVAVLAGRRRRAIGLLVVLGGVAAALVGQDRWLGAVPSGVPGTSAQRLATLAVAAVAGLGGGRLRGHSLVRAPLVLVLALVSLTGAWAGMPETSHVLLMAGVVAGLAFAGTLGGLPIDGWAAATVATLPAVAAGLGAAGNEHALVGGLLCSTTLTVLALVPPGPVVPLHRGLAGVGLHLASVLIAARHVAVGRSWEAAVVPAAVVVALAALSARTLRQRSS